MKYLVFLILLTACSLEPRYRRPCLDLPESWRVESDESSTLANVRWWESLEDPILDALILTAIDNNKDLQVAVWRVCEYLGRYQVAKSPLYPQVDLEAMALKEKFPVQASFLPEGFDPITPHYRFAFKLTYELDFWGRIRSAAHAALEEALAQIENRRTVLLTLISAVANTYIVLRQLDRELEISYLTLEARYEALVYAKNRFEGGMTSEIDVMQALSSYDQTLAVITELKEKIPQQENLLSILLGKNPTCILRGKTISEFTLPPEIPTGLPSELLIRRPDIMKAEDLLIAANAQIGVARADFFPRFSLTGLYGGESFELKTLFSSSSRFWHYGVDLFQPILTGGRLRGQLKIAISQRQEALYEYEQVILNAFKEVNDALVAHRQSKALIIVESDRVAANEEYLKLAWLRYNEGETQYITVLDAERELFRAQIALTRAQGDVFVSMVDIYKALGGGWVIDADCCLRK